MIGESIEIYLDFLQSYMKPGPDQYYRMKATPLIILQMNVNVTAAKKKKKKIKSAKENPGEDEAVEETIFYEPGIDQVEEVLLLPFEILEQTSQTFNKIERDLIPLLNLESQASYPLTKEIDVLSQPTTQVTNLIKEAAKEPLQILDYFRGFSHLIEKSTNSMLKKLFPDKQHSITYLDRTRSKASSRSYGRPKELLKDFPMMRSTVAFSKSEAEWQRIFW